MRRRTIAIFYSMCFAHFIVPYMVSSVTLALPPMGRDLGASAVQLGFVEQFYLIAMAMLLLVSGRLGDLLGRGRVYAGGFLVFSLCTLGLGYAPNIHTLLVLRCIQGAAAAAIMAISNALLLSLFPSGEHGKRLGTLSIFIYGGLTVGPFLGGMIVTHFGWRAVFLSLGPVAGIVSAFCLWSMWNERQEADGEKRMDWPGGIAYAVSTCLILWGTSRVLEFWGRYALAAGVAGIAAFIHLEMRVPSPLLDIGLLGKNRLFSFSLLAALGNYASMAGMTFFIGLYLQYVQGLSPQQTGLVMLIQPVAQMVCAPLGGKLIDRSLVGRERLANIGIFLILIALVAMILTTGRPFSLYCIPFELLLVGVGYGTFIVPNTVLIMSSVEKRHVGMASSMVAVVRNMGMTVSMTSVTLILSIFMGASRVTSATIPEFMTSMRFSLALCAFFAFTGFASSFARGRRKPQQ